jgi:predicted esterase
VFRATIPAIAALLLLALLYAASPQPHGQPPSPTPSPDLREQLQEARAALAERAHDVRVRGVSIALLMSRLDADLSALGAPSTHTPDPDQAGIELAARLDVSLVNQLLGGASLPPTTVGASEMLVASGSGGAVQPLALYVAPSYERARSAPLIIMLPGQGQSETQLIATPFLRALADETGAILAVLSPQVTDSLSDAGGADAYQALDALQASLRVDRRRLYLGGYSAGAFGVFMIAPERPQTWTALLSIAGTLTNQDKTAVVTAMSGKQVFMVVGSDDAEVNAAYVRAAIAYLRGNGVEARYDEQPHGTHSLQSLQPAVERAWRAMFSGVRNVAPAFEYPSPEPTRTIHM